MVEQTELFRRSIGEVTDIVEKEMYTFDDRNGESLTLRPEGTAGCVRAAIQQGLLATPQRLWYAGPMFRYERPQKGRQRQFHQIGVEAFGIATPDMDAELILLSAPACGGSWASPTACSCSSIPSAAWRPARLYRDALVGISGGTVEALDADSQRRLDSNPLRILDSKNPQTQALLDGAPCLADYLDDGVGGGLRHACASYCRRRVSPVEVNPRLVRGLDYYNKTVFRVGHRTSRRPGHGLCRGVATTVWLSNSVAASPCRASASPWAWSVLCCCWQPRCASSCRRGVDADVYVVSGWRERPTGWPL